MNKYFLILTLIISANVFAVTPPKPPAKPVVTQSVEESEVIPTTPITGNVFSINDLQFTSAISGQLQFVAPPGTSVLAGDLIAKVDSTSLDLQLQEQKALITRAEVQLKYLKTNLRRQQNLIKANSVSANSVEQIESQKDVAASDLIIAKLRVKQFEDQISKSEIRAQHNGVITQRLRREGETISPGTIIGSLVDIDNLEIRVQIPLRYTSFVSIGQEVEVFAYGSMQKGKIKSLLPGVDSRNQSYEMRVEIAKDSSLKIGQLVSVAIPIQLPKISMVIHQDALVLREEGSFVYRVNVDNKVEKVMVVTSINLGHFIAVTGELKSGDQVVIRGAETLQDGTEVKINSFET
jgi:RND family efflux transporter MFP subunit